MKLQLFNTLGHTVEAVNPSEPEQIKLYTCGPTVYNYAHIGNLRAYVSADILKRALEYNNYNVEWVMNITDVDDKTIANTVKEFGQHATVADLETFTRRYFEIFLQDLHNVGINDRDISFVNVTANIADIQLFIIELINKGYAYKADDGSTYFSIEKYQQTFGDYGALVGEKFLEGQKIGARVAVDEYEKDNLSDFALWKAHHGDDAEIFWDHPLLGKGRPGWHIECTLINYLKFKHGTDINTGGIDLIFPHHTNEIAQAQPIYKPFVRHWMHSEHLLVDGKKMAKSSGNFYTLADLDSKGLASGADLRYLLLQSHYRTRFNVTEQSLAAAKSGLANLRSDVGRLIAAVGNDSQEQQTSDGQALALAAQRFADAFLEAVNDDLNTPKALAVLSQMISSSEINAAQKLQLAFAFDRVLGLDLEHTATTALAADAVTDSEVAELLQRRNQARADKNFKLSDQLRQQIEAKGYAVLDTPEGTLVEPK